MQMDWAVCPIHFAWFCFSCGFVERNRGGSIICDYDSLSFKKRNIWEVPSGIGKMIRILCERKDINIV